MSNTNTIARGGRILASLSMLVLAVSLMGASVASAKEVKISAALGSKSLLAGEKQSVYLKIGVTGFPTPSETDRTPVNLCVVLDKSGSMQGEKIEKAKEAAMMAIRRLNSEDIISVVCYDTNVTVVIPATKVSDKESIFYKIREIRAGGSTALFAGVSKGAEEIRKFISRNRVNSIILLSDGLANVGPQTPAELGRLGASLGKEGITVSTIGLGLGYGEDLMTQLALNSDGNHFFAEQASDLAGIFDKEFGKALSVVAQKIIIEIECVPGVRPVRIYGRDADVSGRKAVIAINQLYGEREKYVIMEMEVPAIEPCENRKMASVGVTYENMATHATDKKSVELCANFTRARDEVERTINKDVMVDAVEQVGVYNNMKATDLRDQGKVAEAAKALTENNSFLQTNASKYNSKRLEEFGSQNIEQAKNLDEKNWNQTRKGQRMDQSSRARQ
ncbi:MAG: VWA domain-containing protein [Candidatus Sumerlaeota bacterium]|nr:VWA domain-containing protein [Candidatus Sumerlaeota bacterium]